MKRIAFLIASTMLLMAQVPVQVSYRFDEVHSKVLVDRGTETFKVRTGEPGRGGDIVKTGWLGRAVISSPETASRFEIFPGARVELASSGSPGVLVRLEQGKLKAIFDALTGNDDRLVETPGVLLAVRGTRYGVEVDRNARSTLTVFEGTVEVRPLDSSIPPRFVSAGQICEIVRGEPLRLRPMPPGMSEHDWGRRGSSGPHVGEPSRDGRTRTEPQGGQQPKHKPDRGRPH